MTDDEIVARLRRAAAGGAKPVEIAERLGELTGGLTADGFLRYLRKAFAGIPNDVLFNRAMAWTRLSESSAGLPVSDRELDEILGPWISGRLAFGSLTLDVVRADPDGNGEVATDGRLRVVPASGTLTGGDECAIVVADGVTFAVFRRPPMTIARPAWVDAFVYVTNLREGDEAIACCVHVEGDVTTALACFAAALVTSRLRDLPTIVTDPEGREYTVELRATPDFEYGWRGSVMWDADPGMGPELRGREPNVP